MNFFLLGDILHRNNKRSQARNAEFPTIFAIAMDYLPIQASSVPSERAFSSAAETDTARRNRLSPILMESLQMLKFSLRKDLLNFTSDIITPEHDMLDDKYADSDLLGELTVHPLLTNDHQNVMDQIIVAINPPPRVLALEEDDDDTHSTD